MAKNLLRISQSISRLLKTTAKWSFSLALFLAFFFLFLLLPPSFDLRAASSVGNLGQTTVQGQEAPNLQQPQTSNNPANNTEILRQFTAKLKSYPAFEMKFSMVVDGSDFKGVVQSQGESFRLTNSQLELYCNGTTKWIYNIDNKEITITGNDPSQTDLTENPLAFLTSLEKGYSYSEKPRSTTESGKAAWKIELKTVNKKLAYTSITLVVEKSSLKPLAVEYLAKNGTRHVATVSYFVEKKPWPAIYFSFPESRLNGLNVTDLR